MPQSTASPTARLAPIAPYLPLPADIACYAFGNDCLVYTTRRCIFITVSLVAEGSPAGGGPRGCGYVHLAGEVRVVRGSVRGTTLAGIRIVSENMEGSIRGHVIRIQSSGQLPGSGSMVSRPVELYNSPGAEFHLPGLPRTGYESRCAAWTVSIGTAGG